MGARGAAGEASTEEDRERMTAMVTEAVNAGAIGISTSRTLFHRDADGQLAPHVLSGRLELLALAQGLRNAGRGVFQVAPGLSNHQLKDFVDTDTELTAEQYAEQEIDLLSEIAAASGRTLMFTLTDMQEAPGLYHYVLELLAKKNAGDVSMRAQIFPRPIGILFGLDLSLNPFKLHPSYQAIEGLPFAERLAKLRTPELRARILAEKASGDAPDPILQFLVSRSLDGYRMGDQANYDPDPEMKLTEEAARRGMTVWEVAYELMIEGDGKSILYLPLNNFSDGGLDSVHEMLSHPDTVIGLGDGGAHYGLICDASFPTFVLTYWTRDRDGKRLSLPMAVNALTRRSALAVGLDDRGLIAPGYKGDLNVIDYQNLFLHPPHASYTLPAKGRRIVQQATGYEATIVNGEVIYRNGVATGAQLVGWCDPAPTDFRRALSTERCCHFFPILSKDTDDECTSKDHRIIDVDTHVIEPYDLWTSRLSEKKYGELIPQVRYVAEEEEDYWFSAAPKCMAPPSRQWPVGMRIRPSTRRNSNRSNAIPGT